MRRRRDRASNATEVDQKDISKRRPPGERQLKVRAARYCRLPEGDPTAIFGQRARGARRTIPGAALVQCSTRRRPKWRGTTIRFWKAKTR